MSDKWEEALDLGFDGIELTGPASLIEARLRELRTARGRGAVFPTVSSGGRPFIGERDPEARRRAIASLKRLLSLIAELGGLGAATPACFGLYSRSIPSINPPDGDPGGTSGLVEAIAELDAHAEAEGVVLLVEPLNRYEDHYLNRLAEAAELVETARARSVRLLADVFHMNIEEVDIPTAIREIGPRIHHVHLADSNRLEPGAGHLDFPAIFEALKDVGYCGYFTLECSLSGDPAVVFPKVTRELKKMWSPSTTESNNSVPARDDVARRG